MFDEYFLDTLRLATQAAPFVAALIGGLLVPLFVVIAYRYFGFGLFVVSALVLLDTLMPATGSIKVGISLYPSDMGYGLLAFAALLRALFSREFPRRHGAWLIFVAVFFMGLASGLTSFGSIAGVHGRVYFNPIAACSYAMSFAIDNRRIEQMCRSLLWCAVLFCFVTVYRWIVYYTPIPALLPPGGSYNADGAIRVVGSDGVIVMAQAVVLLVFAFFGLPTNLSRRARTLIPAIGLFVLLLQHRSVWLAALVGLFVARLMIPRDKRKPITAGPIVAVVVLAVAGVFAGALSNKVQDLGADVADSANRALTGQGTTAERWNSWQEIIGKWKGGGVRTVLIGNPFGTDMSRYVLDPKTRELRRIDYTAHNYYVQTLFNFGLVGLGAYLALFWVTMRALYRIIRDGKGREPAAAILFTLLAMQLTYDVAYSAKAYQHFMLGVAIAFVAQRQREARGVATTRLARPAVYRGYA